jgi:hypothetical protein
VQWTWKLGAAIATLCTCICIGILLLPHLKPSNQLKNSSLHHDESLSQVCSKRTLNSKHYETFAPQGWAAKLFAIAGKTVHAELNEYISVQLAPDLTASSSRRTCWNQHVSSFTSPLENQHLGSSGSE